MVPRAREAVKAGRETDDGVVLVGDCSVPRYEFLCQKCRKPFELTMTISERG